MSSNEDNTEDDNEGCRRGKIACVVSNATTGTAGEEEIMEGREDGQDEGAEEEDEEEERRDDGD